MPTLLAVDWDPSELRYAVANLAARKISVRAVGSIAIGEDEAAANWTAALDQVQRQHKLRRPKLLIGLPRRDVELLNLTTPPAQDEELPGLIANLAVNESSSVGEDAIVDFVPLDADPAAPRQILAAALPRNVHDRLIREATEASLTPQRIVLRSFATASLYRRLEGPTDEVCLLASRVGSEVNLVLLGGDRVVMARAVRLPDGASASDVSDRLTTEIVRTLTVAPLERPELGPVQRVAIFGDPEEHAELADALTDERSIVIVTLDPFQRLGVAEEVLPDDRSTYTPLLGMLLDEAAGTHAVDFLNPHRPPRSVSRLRIGLAIGGLAAVLALLLAGSTWMELREINDTNEQLAVRLKQLDETMKQVVVRRQVFAAMSSWQKRDINWLDELRDLSIRFPGPRDTMVLRMTLRSQAEGPGEIDFNGLARDPKIVANVEHLLRDEYHQIRNPGVQKRGSEGDYTSQYRIQMRVAPRRRDAYVSHLPAPTPPQPAEGQPAEGPPAERPSPSDSPRVASSDAQEDRP